MVSFYLLMEDNMASSEIKGRKNLKKRIIIFLDPVDIIYTM